MAGKARKASADAGNTLRRPLSQDGSRASGQPLIGMSDALSQFMAYAAKRPPGTKGWTSSAALGTNVQALPGALAFCFVTAYNEFEADDESAETGSQASGP
jgi:hypothetical protein